MPLICCACIAMLAAMSAPTRAVPPTEAVRQFKVADGLEISLVAAEPEIRQPVAMNFDERGRLWVIQYLQYPNPAGLKKVQVDQYMRTRFDRVPEPPPHGPRGADRITICEDTNGDGRADKFKDFVAGLNMATGFCHGYGGVFVAQSPYLLFYPDRNRDDVPDGDPEVLVAGFGMEDSHAYPNSLQIGPDGWLYGAQGSNVWARVEVTIGPHGETIAAPYRAADASAKPADSPPRKYLEFNQCIWRYHPPTHRFEVFAEGGGNTWGADFDRHGEMIGSTNFGGVCGFHFVQGGYYVKGFAKHGPLSNPYAFGYFEHIPYASPQRINQGEHVMCGGIVYQGGALGSALENQYLTCALLHRNIYWHHLDADRSTYKADFGGSLVSTPDPEFRPVDLALAPDASVYIADWCDVRANHVIPEDTWNKTNGRIYRLARHGMKPAAPLDIAKLPAAELIKLLDHSSAWQRREAIRQLGERRAEPAIQALAPALAADLEKESSQPHALFKFWALARITDLPEKLALRMLGSTNPDIAAWTIRLIGDRRESSPKLAAHVRLLAGNSSPVIRRQLASTAARLAPRDGIELALQLATSDDNAGDPDIPLLIWWAIEHDLTRDPRQLPSLLDKFADAAQWKHPIVRDTVAPRMAERLAADDRTEFISGCAALLKDAPAPADVDRIAAAIDRGLPAKQERLASAELRAAIEQRWKASPPSVALVRLALRANYQDARIAAQRLAADAKQPVASRVDLIESLAQPAAATPAVEFFALLAGAHPEPVRAAALQALTRTSDASTAGKLIALTPRLPASLRSQALAAMASRKQTARQLLEAVAAKTIPATEITAELARAIDQHGDADLSALLEKTVGRFGTQTSAEKQHQVDRLAALLAAAKGSTVKADTAEGKAVFAKQCGICHTLHGEGNKIGPDLTGADRGNRPLMLANIVDPSLGIRHEYAASVVRTTSGQILTGIITAETAASLTLVDAKNVQHTIARDEIDELKASPVSLMPEKILDSLAEADIRNLFAYLESGAPRISQPSGPRRSFTFDQSTEGWTLEANAQRTQPDYAPPAAGDRGGCLAAHDADAGAMTLVAPASMLGNLSNVVDGMAWFDARLIRAPETAKPAPRGSFGALTIENGKRSMKQILFHPTIGTPRRESTRYSGRLTAEAFNVDGATFRQILKNVTRITLTIDPLDSTDETVGVDNITLQPK
jgi:putative membrane-bound dehydrogenase-like protein